MSKQKASVYIQDWMKFHPETKQTPCDSYYLGLSKEFFALIQNEEYEDLIYGFDNNDLKDFSCFITCYFEDIISGIGIWQAFTKAHHGLYNKYLPFYKLDEYYQDEINPQDIQFLIWYFISCKFQDEYLSPLNTELVNLSMEIYEIFDREYEIAPENIKLKAIISIPEKETDFFKIQGIIEWIFVDSYLFHFQQFDIENEIHRIMASNDDSLKKNIDTIANDMRDYLSISQPFNLLAYRGNFWLAQILGNNHPLYNEISNLGKRKSGYFIYLNEDDQDYYFQHVASGKELKVTRKSVKKLAEFNKASNLFFINIVKWIGEWWISGSYRIFDYSKEIVKEEKESAESVALLDDNSITKTNEIENQFKLFVEFNEGSPIAFFKNGQEMQTFLERFVEFYNKNENNLEKVKEKIFQGIINRKNLPENHDETDCMVFFDKTIGFQIYFGLTKLIPDKKNTLYNPEGEEDIIDFIYLPQYSPGFVNYLIENYPEMLTEYEKKTNHTFIRDNIDFLLRFKKSDMFN